GYDPSINKAYPWLLSEDVYRLADKYGIVILQPHGRKNTDFIGIGEQDVLIALKKTLRYYAIDKRRVYLLGVSMGGYGAYAIGLHHPHYFAAIAVVAARRYHFLWGEVDRTPLPPPRAQVLKAENPWMLAENATNLPILIIHGENDTLVPVANAFLMARRLSKLGCPVRLNILRNESHWIYFNSSLFRKIFDWFRNKSNSPFPKHVVYRTYTTAYNRCYWLKIDEIAQWGKPANIRASALANGTVYVNTQNVARLTIELNPRLIAPKRQARLILNGVRVWEGELTEPLPLTRFIGAHTANRTDGDDEKLKLAKTQELCGPVWHAYTGPFLIVHGTLGTEAMRLANYNKARQLALEWVDFSDGLAHIKADRDVTEEDLARYHIIAVGGPQENSIVKRAVHSLPIKFAPKGYTIGAHTLRGKQLGLVCIYPNPLNPRRYLVIYDGVLWGRALPINHKFDTSPDFAIFTSEQDADGANVLLCAGFFDSHWQVDERLIWCVQEQCPAGFQVNN
ncbi:MAG TPA: hypothetical protein EYP10_15400, partial [Armatimonadetes bacterium]|nr:hypothetical protein [Armatimonadota bacterium]